MSLPFTVPSLTHSSQLGLRDKRSVTRIGSYAYCAITTGLPYALPAPHILARAGLTSLPFSGRVSAILVALALGVGLVFQGLRPSSLAPRPPN